MARKSSETMTVTVKNFTLELPPPFDMKPMAVIPVSANYSAHVYTRTRNCDRYDEDGKRVSIRVDGWQTYIRHNDSGLPPPASRISSIHRYRVEDEYWNDDPLSVKVFLESWASALAPKKRRGSYVEEEYED